MTTSTTQSQNQRGGRKHPHYFKSVAHLTEVDVYRVLELFGVTDQALGHAIKKLLVAGGRGVKDQRKDIEEARDTLQRRLEMMDEDAAPVAAVPYVGTDRRSPDRKPTCDCAIKFNDLFLKRGSRKGEVWVGWTLFSRPVPSDVRVHVLLRNGSIQRNMSAGLYKWNNEGKPGDVVAFCIADQNGA